MRISQETIDQIRYKVDIVEVVGDFVSLKKKGKDYSACCPFHEEKTPSFSVSPVRGIYKCFGCGMGGDAIKFIMDIEKSSYTEALKYLAKKYNIEIQENENLPDEEIAKQNERDSLFIVLNYAKNYFRDQLLNTEEGRSIGLSYFKERGFNDKTIEIFELGYTENLIDKFTKTALKNGYQLEILKKAGLTIQKEDSTSTQNPYDRFRDRVIFPIHNLSGRVIAFGARTLSKDKNQPKYLNSPETELYHKHQVLYGIFQAKNAIRKDDECYLTEGYTDVISLYQAGIQNVVASSGTSLTNEQIRLIHRFTKNVTLLFDGDQAGIKAALRGLDMLLSEGMQVKVVVFPDKEDPDSYVKKVGTEKFKLFVKKEGKDLITFKTDIYLKDAENDPFKKANVITEVVESISRIPDAITRAVFFKQTANMLGVAEETLIFESNKILLKKNKDQAGKSDDEKFLQEYLPSETEVEKDENEIGLEEEKNFNNLISYQEEESIRLLLSFADDELEKDLKLIAYFITEMEGIEFETPIYQNFINIYRNEFKAGRIANSKFFIHHHNPDIQSEAIRLLSNQHSFSDNWEKYEIIIPTELNTLPSAAYSNILRLKQRKIQKVLKEVSDKLQQNDEWQEQEKYLKIYRQLKTTEVQIANLLGNTIR